MILSTKKYILVHIYNVTSGFARVENISELLLIFSPNHFMDSGVRGVGQIQTFSLRFAGKSKLAILFSPFLWDSTMHDNFNLLQV